MALCLACALPLAAQRGWPAGLYAPYVMVDQQETAFPLAEQADHVSRYYTLAFIIDRAGGGTPSPCDAAWDGRFAPEPAFYGPQIDRLRAAGGDVIVSFGGEAGRELARDCPDVASLADQYQRVIDAYQLTSIDFDIEGDWLADAAANQRRNQAIALLQQRQPDLQVSFTLPVAPEGLGQPALDMLHDAVSRGVRIAVVNIMIMDYSTASLAMGLDAVEAAEATIKQLHAIYPERTRAELATLLGLTPMIGINDVVTQRFTLHDAQQLVDYARENAVGRLSMWQVYRDQPCAPRQESSSLCSGVPQRPWAFSQLFQRYQMPRRARPRRRRAALPAAAEAGLSPVDAY